METNTQAIAIPEQPRPGTPAAMISAAIESGRDVNELEQLYALQRQWEADQARKAFHAAMAAFKQNPPDIIKDKVNSQYKTNSGGGAYASIASLVNTTNKALAPHGLNARWETVEQSEKGMKIACILAHAQGHEERVELWGPMDTSGSKNPLQAVKSTATYLRAATFEMVTGVASRDKTVNPDDDGNGSHQKPETTEQREAREASERKEAEWLAKIQGCTSLSDYEGQRVDLLAAYGGSGSNVPPALRDFCVQKKKALQAAEKIGG